MAKDEKGGEAGGAEIALMMERLTRLVRSAEHSAELNPAQWETLRYLSRANRFSNSPTALTRYLGATKGTISQTIKALERKGYLVKAVRPGERRSVTLNMTEKGLAAVRDNAWSGLAARADKLGGKTRRRMERGLGILLADMLAQGKHLSFGTCPSCSFFSAASNCSVFNEKIDTAERTRLCSEYQSRDH